MINAGISLSYDELVQKVAEHYGCDVKDIFDVEEHNKFLYKVTFITPGGTYTDLLNKSEVE